LKEVDSVGDVGAEALGVDLVWRRAKRREEGREWGGREGREGEGGREEGGREEGRESRRSG